MALATLHNPTVAHQIQLFEQELSQGISEGLGCDALGLVALCQRLGIIVLGEDCADKSLQPSHTEKRRKQTKTQTQIVTEVCLGSQSCRFSVLSRKERFKDMLEAFPSGWQVGKATAEEVLEKIHQQIKRFGERHGWAKMGKNGFLLKQHIVHKLWLLMSNSLGINQSQIRWKDWRVATMDRLFFDGQGLFRNAPRHWTDMQRFISVAPEVPVSMHWHWMCLVGQHPINPNGFAEKLCEFIEAGCEDDTQAAARAIFEAERERLSASKFAAPSPLAVLRGLWQSGALDVEARTARTLAIGTNRRLRDKTSVSNVPGVPCAGRACSPACNAKGSGALSPACRAKGSGALSPACRAMGGRSPSAACPAMGSGTHLPAGLAGVARTAPLDELPDESAIDASAADCAANFRKRPKGSSQLSAKRKRQPSRPKQPRQPKCQHGS